MTHLAEIHGGTRLGVTNGRTLTSLAVEARSEVRITADLKSPFRRNSPPWRMGRLRLVRERRAVMEFPGLPPVAASACECGEAASTTEVRTQRTRRRQRSAEGADMRYIEWLWDQQRAGPDGYFGSGG